MIFFQSIGRPKTSDCRYCGIGLPIVNIGTLMAMGKRDPERTAFGQRLFESRDRIRPKLSQEMAAMAVGMSQSNLAELEQKRHSSGKTSQLAALYGCDAHWLATGEGQPQYKAVAAEPNEVYSVAPAGRRASLRRVWAVGKTQGGMPERVWDDGDQPVGRTDQFADLASADPQAFLCKVVGNSMSPRFNPGEFALVEPNETVDIEDDVLVRLKGGAHDGKTMLKRLLSLRGGVKLGSYNDSETFFFEPDEVSWIYYVASHVPAKKMRERLDDDPRDAPPSVRGELSE